VPSRLRQFRRLVVEAAFLPVAVLGALAGVLLWQVLHLQEVNDRERHADVVLARIGRIERLHVDGDAGLRGFLLSGDERLLEPFERAERELRLARLQLAELVAGEPAQLERLERIGQAEARWRELADDTLARRRAGVPAALAADRVPEAEAVLDDVRVLVRSFELDEEARRTVLEGGAAHITRRTVLLGGLLALALMLLVGLSAARQMRRVARTFARAVGARDDFISVASHELKTPLTALQLQVQLLARSLERPAEGGPEQRPERRLAVVEQSARRLAELVNRLLDVSQLGAGTLRLSRERLDLARLAEECVQRLADRCQARGVRVAVRAAPSEGDWDRLRLESVVVNLLDNALKYGEGAPIEVTVEDRGASARLRVRDGGPGIAREHQARIFERYERAVGDRPFEGLGVGLWLSRAIVEAHGGTIEVESAPGRGAAFTVALPKDAKAQAAVVALR
jgi:signal transduction histidine kinase